MITFILPLCRNYRQKKKDSNPAITPEKFLQLLSHILDELDRKNIDYAQWQFHYFNPCEDPDTLDTVV